MRRVCLVLVLVLGAGCARDRDTERLESMENRLQATEFQLATVSEMEPRFGNRVQTLEGRFQEWASEWSERIESNREQAADMKGRLLAVEERLEQTEEWIREKQKEEEQERKFATPDGTIPEAWKQLESKCRLTMAAEAQTSLNFLVRIDRYMSEFPVHHPVELEQEDPLTCMTSNLVWDSAPLKQEYRHRELAILKSRDQWLGYRIDRSWEKRPERGDCRMACCNLALDGTWGCQWGWDGGRWECEYDVEGWRNYNHRWHRKCDYIPETTDFYSRPYLMAKMEERKLAVPEKLYCVVDLVWENRVYCLSHDSYPVMQFRLPEDPEKERQRPLIGRFSVISINNWDVLYKDEWSSMWIITGVDEPEFEGQLAGLNYDIIQEPECCAADNPEGVFAVEKELLCVPEPRRQTELPSIILKHGFKDGLDYEIERMGVIHTPATKAKLDEVRALGCPQL